LKKFQKAKERAKAKERPRVRAKEIEKVSKGEGKGKGKGEGRAKEIERVLKGKGKGKQKVEGKQKGEGESDEGLRVGSTRRSKGTSVARLYDFLSPQLHKCRCCLRWIYIYTLGPFCEVSFTS
jgi:hypothetical protein